MTARPAPYPADTKAKGWRFELDLEQVQQSDTWALAAEVPMAQHALLMMWATAWQQVPCGAMPSDHALIRAKLKIPPKLWAPMTDVVLRGWWLADDGRLYHNTIVSRVLAMLGAKEEARQRKADYRARKDSERQAQESKSVPKMSHGTDQGQQQDEHGKDNTGTGTGTGTSNTSSLRSDVKPARASRKPAADAAPTLTVADLTTEGVDKDHAAAWFVVRKGKNAKHLTQVAWDNFKAEAKKAGITTAQAVHVCVIADWRGFKSSWPWQQHAQSVAGVAVGPGVMGGPAPAPLNRQEALEQRNKAVAAKWLANHGAEDARS